MANDCLVTKLKAVVNDDNLNYFGCIRIKMNAPAGSLVNINVNYGEGSGKLRIVGDGYFTSNNEKEITINGSSIVGVSVGTSYDLLIQKEGLTIFGFGSSNTYVTTLELEQFYGCPVLTAIITTKAKFIGSVSELLYNVPSINSFGTYGTVGSVVTGNFDKEVSAKKSINFTDSSTSIIGDINNFKNWSGTTAATLAWRGTGITGELSTLFDYIAAHSSISSISIVPNTLTTLNGTATTTTTKTVTFSNGSWSIS